MKFKVGDRVKIRKDLIVDEKYNRVRITPLMKKYFGRTAVITAVSTEFFPTYELDIDHRRWCWTDDMLEPVKNTHEIHITVDKDGVTTHGILKEDGKVIKHSIAKCHPDDKFDFSVGANIVAGRLFESDEKKEAEKKKYYTGKIICIRESDEFTKGKIYDVVDGVINGYTLRYYFFKSIEEINNYFYAKFIELVE